MTRLKAAFAVFARLIRYSFQAFVQRLQTRSQFQAVLAGVIVAKTDHFALHCNPFDTRVESNLMPVAIGRTVVSKRLPDSQAATQDQMLSVFPVQDVWLGAMVPKRWARRAVTRNAIRRQIYAVSASLQAPYPLAAFVIRLRREFSRQHFVSAESSQLKEAVREEVLALLQAGLIRA